MTFSRFKPKRLLQFLPAIGLLAVSASLRAAPALAQGEDEVFHYLIPLAEAVNLCESGLHEQAINKTSKLYKDLARKKSITPGLNPALPVLRADTSGGDVLKQLQSETLALRGVSSFTLKRTPQAIADLKQAATISPNHAHVLTELGTVLVKSKKNQDGIAALTRAIKINPNIREAYFMRASGYQHIGKYKEARLDRARAQKLYVEQQKNIDTLTERIDKLVQENKISEALELDRQLLQLAPRDGLAVTGYADHLVATGKDKEALNFVSTSIALDPTIAYSYRIRSIINSQMQKIDAELRDANIAFALEPRSLEALNARAIANLDADQPVQAIRDFNLFVKRNPDFPDAYINRSAAYLRVGETEKAITDARHAISLLPASPYGYQCLGAALRRAGKLNEAREALETSLRYTKHASTDSVAMAQFNLGAVLRDMNDPKSVEHFDAAIKLAPTLPDVFLLRGAYNASLGQLDDGIKILTRKYTRTPNNPKLSKIGKTKPAARPAPRGTASLYSISRDSSNRGNSIYSTGSNSKKTLPRITVGSHHNPNMKKMPPPGMIVISKSPAKNGGSSVFVPRKIEVSLQDLHDCIFVSSRMIEINPGKADAYFTRGMAELCLKQYEQAASDFRKLTEISKTGFAYQRALALAFLSLERSGKTSEAKSMLELACEQKAGTTSSTMPTITFADIKYFCGKTPESAVFEGKLSNNELTRRHSYLAFHFNSIADKTKASTHARWVLERGDLSSPELILTAADRSSKAPTHAD